MRHANGDSRRGRRSSTPRSCQVGNLSLSNAVVYDRLSEMLR
jgi:hypothetical protein